MRRRLWRDFSPGDPEKCASAGTTQFGSRTVLSAIFAQSLMIANLPCAIENPQTFETWTVNEIFTYYNAVLANLYVIANSSSFHDRVCSNVHEIANFHGIIVEISAKCLVRWP